MWLRLSKLVAHLFGILVRVNRSRSSRIWPDASSSKVFDMWQLHVTCRLLVGERSEKSFEFRTSVFPPKPLPINKWLGLSLFHPRIRSSCNPIKSCQLLSRKPSFTSNVSSAQEALLKAPTLLNSLTTLPIRLGKLGGPPQTTCQASHTSLPQQGWPALTRYASEGIQRLTQMQVLGPTTLPDRSFMNELIDVRVPKQPRTQTCPQINGILVYRMADMEMVDCARGRLMYTVDYNHYGGHPHVVGVVVGRIPDRGCHRASHTWSERPAFFNHVSQGITKTGHMRERHLMLLAWMSHPPSLAPWQAKASTPHHLRLATTRKQHTMA
ncbi:hypothetical protein TIFTF001_032560 [Ficus carica]|uniref:Uncharacterized protein n=1 Tax=Ficus carica TaxID=3494 RepID=A0AA88DYN2_FICCA|nr:hypothetical protein TIFTF001_032560 [Ficus carica]